MPRAGDTAVPAGCPGVEEVLEGVRGLLRRMETGPESRNDWHYRFAALGAVVWPEGLDRRHLADMPLARRTRNCLRDAGLLSGTAAFTTRDLLLPNFGKRTYGDLLSAIERLLALFAEDPAACVPNAMSPELLELARRTETGQIAPVELAKFGAGLRSAVAVLRARLDAVVAVMSPGQRAAVGRRLLEEPRPTFAAIGRRLGVTGSRAQQLHAAVERHARRAAGAEAPFAAAILKSRLGHVVEEGAMRRHLDTVVGREDGLAERLLRDALLERMDYVLACGAYLDVEANGLIGKVRSRAHARADDAGLVDESELLALLRVAGARPKAALLSLGRPATREEIAGVCGLTGDDTAGRLSRLPSVVRATKRHWALAARVDEDYRGIAGEIVRRIREDGGATTAERVLAELPARFGVTVGSVRAFLRTRRFVVRRGRVRLVDRRSVKLGPPGAVAHGRDADGAPYWTFRVGPHVLEGFSVTGFPPEFAQALGCEREGGALVAIDNLPECRDLSVRWRLASTTGASLGRIAGALRALGIGPGESARVTLKGPPCCCCAWSGTPGCAGSARSRW